MRASGVIVVKLLEKRVNSGEKIDKMARESGEVTDN